MRARHPERRFLAYFFAAVGTKNVWNIFEHARMAQRVKARDGFHREVRRQQANLEIPAQDFGYTCMKLPARARRNDDSILFL